MPFNPLRVLWSGKSDPDTPAAINLASVASNLVKLGFEIHPKLDPVTHEAIGVRLNHHPYAFPLARIQSWASFQHVRGTTILLRNENEVWMAPMLGRLPQLHQTPQLGSTPAAAAASFYRYAKELFPSARSVLLDANHKLDGSTIHDCAGTLPSTNRSPGCDDVRQTILETHLPATLRPHFVSALLEVVFALRGHVIDSSALATLLPNVVVLWEALTGDAGCHPSGPGEALAVLRMTQLVKVGPNLNHPTHVILATASELSEALMIVLEDGEWQRRGVGNVISSPTALKWQLRLCEGQEAFVIDFVAAWDILDLLLTNKEELDSLYQHQTNHAPLRTVRSRSQFVPEGFVVSLSIPEQRLELGGLKHINPAFSVLKKTFNRGTAHQTTWARLTVAHCVEKLAEALVDADESPETLSYLWGDEEEEKKEGSGEGFKFPTISGYRRAILKIHRDRGVQPDHLEVSRHILKALPPTRALPEGSPDEQLCALKAYKRDLREGVKMVLGDNNAAFLGAVIKQAFDPLLQPVANSLRANSRTELSQLFKRVKKLQQEPEKPTALFDPRAERLQSCATPELPFAPTDARLETLSLALGTKLAEEQVSNPAQDLPPHPSTEQLASVLCTAQTDLLLDQQSAMAHLHFAKPTRVPSVGQWLVRRSLKSNCRVSFAAVFHQYTLAVGLVRELEDLEQEISGWEAEDQKPEERKEDTAYATALEDLDQLVQAAGPSLHHIRVHDWDGVLTEKLENASDSQYWGPWARKMAELTPYGKALATQEGTIDFLNTGCCRGGMTIAACLALLGKKGISMAGGMAGDIHLSTIENAHRKRRFVVQVARRYPNLKIIFTDDRHVRVSDINAEPPNLHILYLEAGEHTGYLPPAQRTTTQGSVAVCAVGISGHGKSTAARALSWPAKNIVNGDEERYVRMSDNFSQALVNADNNLPVFIDTLGNGVDFQGGEVAGRSYDALLALMIVLPSMRAKFEDILAPGELYVPADRFPALCQRILDMYTEGKNVDGWIETRLQEVHRQAKELSTQLQNDNFSAMVAKVEAQDHLPWSARTLALSMAAIDYRDQGHEAAAKTCFSSVTGERVRETDLLLMQFTRMIRRLQKMANQKRAKIKELASNLQDMTCAEEVCQPRYQPKAFPYTLHVLQCLQEDAEEVLEIGDYCSLSVREIFSVAAVVLKYSSAVTGSKAVQLKNHLLRKRVDEMLAIFGTGKKANKRKNQLKSPMAGAIILSSGYKPKTTMVRVEKVVEQVRQRTTLEVVSKTYLAAVFKLGEEFGEELVGQHAHMMAWYKAPQAKIDECIENEGPLECGLSIIGRIRSKEFDVLVVDKESIPDQLKDFISVKQVLHATLLAPVGQAWKALSMARRFHSGKLIMGERMERFETPRIVQATLRCMT
jgi:hypothetical protein